MSHTVRKHRSNRAIFILESPWELDDSDSNRSSVVPFVEGIAKLAGDTEVYYANFYDKSSFDKALECLCKNTFKNCIVYIAAHGYKHEIGNVSIVDLLYSIGLKSKDFNITGVMLGSCFVGEHTSTMQCFIEGTNLKWCAGYSSTSEWLLGTMIDCSIISNMSELNERDYSNKQLLINKFSNAILPFNKNFIIGTNYNEEPVELKNSLQVVIQPSGQGHRARTVSSFLF